MGISEKGLPWDIQNQNLKLGSGGFGIYYPLLHRRATVLLYHQSRSQMFIPLAPQTSGKD
jgi:hypothetical protein